MSARRWRALFPTPLPREHLAQSRKLTTRATEDLLSPRWGDRANGAGGTPSPRPPYYSAASRLYHPSVPRGTPPLPPASPCIQLNTEIGENKTLYLYFVRNISQPENTTPT